MGQKWRDETRGGRVRRGDGLKGGEERMTRAENK